jgi:hypothetical protein
MEEVERLLDAEFIRPCRYAEWVPNIIPIEKKNTGKIQVCIDFHNLNKATPKDEYPMPIADMLINNTSGHGVINFLDGNAGYNQIFMVEEGMSKTAFRCPKCVFGVSAGKFLGFIIHEHGIEIDPTKIESINKVQPPQCKNNMQKFLGKLNYLRQFIFNLSGKISAFAPILQLKNESEFTWGRQISNAPLMTSKSTYLRHQ